MRALGVLVLGCEWRGVRCECVSASGFARCNTGDAALAHGPRNVAISAQQSRLRCMMLLSTNCASRLCYYVCVAAVCLDYHRIAHSIIVQCCCHGSNRQFTQPCAACRHSPAQDEERLGFVGRDAQPLQLGRMGYGFCHRLYLFVFLHQHAAM